MVSSSTQNPPKVQKIVVSAEYAGQRMDNFLFTHLKGVPKTRLYKGIRTGEVRVNRGRVKPDYRLVVGDLLRIPPLRRSTIEKPLIGLSKNHQMAQNLLDHILFEDDGMIVLNKPAGIAVHGGSGVSFGVIEALRHLKNDFKHLELVHRLDRETSGCLIIAKSRSTLRAIHEQFRMGKVEKLYWCLVKGSWQGGTIAAPLQKNQLLSGERMVKVSKEGQESLTIFKHLKAYAGVTLVEAYPKTGRTHQIRVHAASVGHPIIGDEKYGDAEFNQKLKIKGIKRLFLHARAITLTLPNYDTPISIEAPLDPLLQTSLQKLEGE